MCEGQCVEPCSNVKDETEGKKKSWHLSLHSDKISSRGSYSLRWSFIHSKNELGQHPPPPLNYSFAFWLNSHIKKNDQGIVLRFYFILFFLTNLAFSMEFHLLSTRQLIIRSLKMRFWKTSSRFSENSAVLFPCIQETLVPWCHLMYLLSNSWSIELYWIVFIVTVHKI